MTDSTHLSQPLSEHPVLILSGGRSQRMGQDKAQLMVGGKTMLQRVDDAMARLSEQRILVIGHDATPPTNCGFETVIRDQYPDRGPLEGLRVGLEYLSDSPIVFVGTCDAPSVIADVYHAMVAELGPEDDAVVPRVQGQVYPLTAVYRTRVIGQVQSMVQEHRLRVKDLLELIKVRWFPEQHLRAVDPDGESLKNVNTQQEYLNLIKRQE